jgi:hypothetical protein
MPLAGKPGRLVVTALGILCGDAFGVSVLLRSHTEEGGILRAGGRLLASTEPDGHCFVVVMMVDFCTFEGSLYVSARTILSPANTVGEYCHCPRTEVVGARREVAS